MHRGERDEPAERGAVALLAAFTSVILMLVSALVIDIGMQRVARGDMQALADVVALDLARDLDGRTVAQLAPVVDADAAASAARNTSGLSEDTPDLDVQLGTLRSDGSFEQLAAGVPTAVRVGAATKVAFAFASFTGTEDGAVNRAAVSTANSNACFRLGSFAAALDTGDSALAGVFESMLGSEDALGVNLRSVGYSGLLTSTVDVARLAAEMGVGSPEALVDQGDVSVKGLFAASARVLDATGQSSAGAVLGDIAAKMSASVVANMGDILTVGGGSVAGLSINAADLLGGAGLAAALHTSVADHNNLLHTGVAWAAPHASNGDIELSVIEAPQQGCGTPGNATASTGQVRLKTSIGFNLPNKIDGLTASAADTSGTQASISVDAELGGAEGTLSGISCGKVTETRVRVSTRLTSLSVDLAFRLTGTIAGVQLNLLAHASSTVGTAASGGAADTLYDVPPHDYTDPQPSAGSSSAYVGLETPKVTLDLAGSSASVAGVKVDLGTLGSILDPILSTAGSSVIGSSLATLTDNLNQALTPVAELLGIRFAGADVFGVPTPTCAQPRLAG